MHKCFAFCLIFNENLEIKKIWADVSMSDYKGLNAQFVKV